MPWEWSPFKYFRLTPGARAGAVVGREIENIVTPQDVITKIEIGLGLSDLPQEIRAEIWAAYLSGQDQRTLRLVSKGFQREMEATSGLKVALCGPELNKLWRFDYGESSYRLITEKMSPEQLRAFQENVAWIQKMTFVRSLYIKHLEIPFDPKLFLRNPDSLRRLALELEYGNPRQCIIDFLSLPLKSLQEIQVSCLPPTTNTTENEPSQALQAFRDHAVDFTDNIRSTLSDKPNLKELIIRADLWIDPKKPESRQWSIASFRGCSKVVLAGDTTTKYSNKLRVLQLSLPILLRDTELWAWKGFLDRQETLTQLSVDFGFIHWKYFCSVLERNAPTLRHLELCLGNCAQLRPSWAKNEPVAELPIDSLDWAELLGNAQGLKSLKLSMSDMYPKKYVEHHPRLSRNFRLLNLPNLERLELHFVRLKQLSLAFIFTRLPCLRELKMSHWNSLDLTDYSAESKGIYSLVAAMLPRTALRKIHLFDRSLRSCPIWLKMRINSYQNYVVSWQDKELARSAMLNDYKLGSPEFEKAHSFKVTRNRI